MNIGIQKERMRLSKYGKMLSSGESFFVVLLQLMVCKFSKYNVRKIKKKSWENQIKMIVINTLGEGGHT